MIKWVLLAWKVVFLSLGGFVEILHRLEFLLVDHGDVVVYTSRYGIIKTRREEPNGARNDMHGMTSIEYSRDLSSSGNLTLVILIRCLGFFFWTEYSF